MAKATTHPNRPEQLAETLGVKAKQLRAYLRSEFPRDPEQKGTSWELNEKQIKACVEHFSTEEDEA